MSATTLPQTHNPCEYRLDAIATPTSRPRKKAPERGGKKNPTRKARIVLPREGQSVIRETNISPPRKRGGFLRFPLEVRSRIYAYALTSSTPISWPRSPSRASTSLSPALLATCKLIYTEAAALLYSGNILRFSHPSDLNIFVHIFSLAHTPLLNHILLNIQPSDVKLWTHYNHSLDRVRSITADCPNLTTLDITYIGRTWHHGHMLAAFNATDPMMPPEARMPWQNDPRLRALCLSLDGKLPKWKTPDGQSDGGKVRVTVLYSLGHQTFLSVLEDSRRPRAGGPEGYSGMEFDFVGIEYPNGREAMILRTKFMGFLGIERHQVRLEVRYEVTATAHS